MLGGDCGAVRIALAQHAIALDPAEAYQVIKLGGQEAAIVPLPDLRRLQAVDRRAPAEVVEQAEVETTLAAHCGCAAARRRGAVSHERAMEELLGEP